MRASELEGRQGKQPDGTSKTREVKLCTIWSAEGRDEEGTPVRDAGSVTCSAAIESAASKDTDEEPSAFAERAMPEATRRGFERAKRRAVLGEGGRECRDQPGKPPQPSASRCFIPDASAAAAVGLALPSRIELGGDPVRS